MSNPFRCKKTVESDKPTRFYSNLQEKAVAKSIDGKQQPNSGATFFKKGDVVTDDELFLLECKTCVKDQKTFTVHEDWFIKNRQESLQEQKDYSAVVFSFGPNKENYYVIDEMLFQELLQHLREQKEN